MGVKHLYFIKFMYNIIKVENLASDNFFAENFCLVDDRVFYCQYLGLSLSLKDLQNFFKHGSAHQVFMDKMKFVKDFALKRHILFLKKLDRQDFISCMSYLPFYNDLERLL